MNNNTNKTARDNRRYKYGSLSLAFTLVFLALILAVNLIFSSLSLSGKLTVDLTPEEFTSIGDETQKLLTDLGKDLDVTIYFMSARDIFELEANDYNGINLTAICRDLAENYATTFDGSGDKGIVRVEYKELDKDPEFERKYLEEAGTSLVSTSVIVQGKYHYRVLDLSSFYTLDENGKYTAFKGEYRLTTAILRASVSEQPVATLTYGHGEPINTDGTVKDAASGLVSVLTEAGFQVETADISREEINPNTKILISYDPVTDFSYNEIDVLSKYIADRHSFMAFVDSSTPELPSLQSFLKENWGLNYKPSNRITDGIHSVNNESKNVVAKTPSVGNVTEDNSASYQIRKTVFDFEGAINTVFPESVELELSDSVKEGVVSEKVLTTNETAVSENFGTEQNKGEMPLMLLSASWGYGENNVTEYSYVCLVGSTDFANTASLNKNYGNRRVMLAASRVFGSENVAPNIEAKTFGDTALDIESGTAKTLTWLICTIVPGIIMIFGVVVFFKRRHM